MIRNENCSRRWAERIYSSVWKVARLCFTLPSPGFCKWQIGTVKTKALSSLRLVTLNVWMDTYRFVWSKCCKSKLSDRDRPNLVDLQRRRLWRRSFIWRHMNKYIVFITSKDKPWLAQDLYTCTQSSICCVWLMWKYAMLTSLALLSAIVLTESICHLQKIFFCTNMNAAMAQCIRLLLPSCRPAFESQAHHLSFYKFIIV